MQDVSKRRRYFHSNQKINEDGERKRFEQIKKQLQIQKPDNYRDILDISYKHNYPNKTPLESKQKDIENMMVNAIRHKFSNYMTCIHKIDHIYLYPNINNYAIFKNYTLECIAQEYPFLQEACNQQKRTIKMVKICDS